MKKYALAATGLTLLAGAAQAGGLDRSYTPIDMIFEKGNYAELSFGFTSPDLTGSDVLGNQISNVGNDFGIGGAGLKLDFGDKVSFALIFDQPYGADVEYGGDPAATMLGGTLADAESDALTALLKYRVTDRISIYGGPRVVQAEGKITLSGFAYGAASGSNFSFASDNGVGAVVGASYEIPDIALRVALTYHSSIDLNMRTTETLPGGPGPVSVGDTNSELPETWELSAQTGIAQNTLLFGSIRHSEWSAFTLTPPLFGINLAELDDSTTYELGVGRRFSDRLSGSVAISFEEGGSDDLVSPLAPTNGLTALTVGAKYKINDMFDISGGIRYTWVGDGDPETGTPDVQRGTFKDNNAISAGLKLGIHF